MSRTAVVRMGRPRRFFHKSEGRSVVAVFVASLLASTSAYGQARPQPQLPQQPRPQPQPQLPPQGNTDPWMAPPSQAQGAPTSQPGFGVDPNAMPGASGVFVEMRSDSPNARIDQVYGGGTIPACQVPCRKVLRGDSVYVIQGEGMRATSNFVLPTDRQAVTLDVQAGSTSRMAGGVVLMAGGLGAAYLGLIFWSLGATQNSLGTVNGTGPGEGNTKERLGGAMLLIGIPAALLGLYVVMTTHTHVTSSTGATFTQDTPAPRKRSLIALTPRGLEF